MSTERERKYEGTVPSLARLVPPGGRLDEHDEHLTSAYLDTADRALQRARMTLRRRTGTNDVGWQLKIPSGPFREEVRVDADPPSEQLPAALGTLLRGITRGHPLLPVATLVTARHVSRVTDADGLHLLDVAADRVTATTPAGTSEWAEVEVELGDDAVPDEVLDRADKALRKGGLRISSSASKVGRALGAVAGPTHVVAAYVVEQQRVILAGDLALRRGDDSVIHRTRVAVRRVRSVLRVFGPLLGASSLADEDLRWWAAVLGDVRDAQVLRTRLDAAADAADEDDGAAARKRIDEALDASLTEHWATLQASLDGDRYLALLAALDAWVLDPPVVASGRKKAARLATKAERTTVKRLRKGARRGDPSLLHQARKAAKRARYAAEVVDEPTVAKRFTKVQDLLGEHQDAVVAAELLHRLGAGRGAGSFTLGVLHERQLAAAARARKKAREAARTF